MSLEEMGFYEWAILIGMWFGLLGLYTLNEKFEKLHTYIENGISVYVND